MEHAFYGFGFVITTRITGSNCSNIYNSYKVISFG